MSSRPHQTPTLGSTVHRDFTTEYKITVDGISVYVTKKRVKNMNLRFTPDGELHLSVPYGVSRSQIDSTIRKHRSWIERNRHKMQSSTKQRQRTFAAGEKIYMWGKVRTIEYADVNHATLAVAKDMEPTLRLPNLPAKLNGDAPQSIEFRKQLVIELFSHEVRQEVERIYPACAQEVGAAASSITIRYMTTRWGSCTPSTRRIRMNSALAAYDPRCLRQVLIHELCHIHEANHSPRFWALMNEHCPDWRTWQAELKSRGPLDLPR